MRLRHTKDGWMFLGSTVPMALARKAWRDRYDAVTAANREGYDCFANGEVREMPDAPDDNANAARKSEGGAG